MKFQTFEQVKEKYQSHKHVFDRTRQGKIEKLIRYLNSKQGDLADLNELTMLVEGGLSIARWNDFTDEAIQTQIEELRKEKDKLTDTIEALNTVLFSRYVQKIDLQETH